MTFPKWRSYGYKPLESSRHKRRNTIGAIRGLSSRKIVDSAAALSLSGSLSRSTEEETAPSPLSRAENGTTYAPPLSSATKTVDETFSCSSSSSRYSTEQEVPTARSVNGGGRTRPRRSLSASGWTASLLLRPRLSLRRRPSGSRRLRASLSPSPEREEPPSPNPAETSSLAKEEEERAEEESDSSESASHETTDAELETVLQDAWRSILAVGEVAYSGFLRRKQALEYSRKMSELRQQYQLKLAEIQQREATFAREFLSHDESTPLLRADELTAPLELKRALRDTRISGRFDKQRLELKRETAAAAVCLRARYPSLQVRLRDENKSQRPRSCHWPASTTIYCNPQTDVVQQSGSMVGIYDGFYATDNTYSDQESLYMSDSKTGGEENEHRFNI